MFFVIMKILETRGIKVMKEKFLLITVFVFCMCFINSELYAKSIPLPYVYSTIYIQNPSTKKAGTGFLVSRQIAKDSYKVFLVSNKHVLIPKPLTQQDSNKEAKAVVFLNKEENGEIKIQIINIILRDKDGTDLWKGHTNPDIDVACIDLTSYISENRTVITGLKIGFISEDRFATKEVLEKYFISIGDQIISLGYPLNLVEGGHSIPIARGGTISSWPTRNFRNLPLILIDSTMIRGSSGSPVFLPELPYTYSSETEISLATIRQAYLLGIQGELIIDWQLIVQKTISFGQQPQEIDVIDSANFGIIYKAETISETIDMFGKPLWTEKSTNVK
jgi:hypothetical protein